MPFPLTPGSTSHRVLIVDRSDDNREVLRTVLQRHGCEIFEARGDTEGLRLVRQVQPQLVVLDLDTLDPADDALCTEFGKHAGREKMDLVLLGKTTSGKARFRTSNAVPKPYHYAPLIRKIEELLQKSDRPA